MCSGRSFDLGQENKVLTLGIPISKITIYGVDYAVPLPVRSRSYQKRRLPSAMDPSLFAGYQVSPDVAVLQNKRRTNIASDGGEICSFESIQTTLQAYVDNNLNNLLLAVMTAYQ